MAHPAVSTTVVYCLQSQLPTHQSANVTVHCTQNEKIVTIQLCQYRYLSSNNEWLVHNKLEWTWKELVMACLKNYCNICLKRQRKAKKICHASLCHGQDSHKVLPSEPIPSVDLHNIIHHCYQNKCLIHIPVYLSMTIP